MQIATYGEWPLLHTTVLIFQLCKNSSHDVFILRSQGYHSACDVFHTRDISYWTE